MPFWSPVVFRSLFFQHNQVLFLIMNEFINFVYSMSFSEEDKVSWHVYKLWRAGTLPQTPPYLPAPIHCLLRAGAVGTC